MRATVIDREMTAREYEQHQWEVEEREKLFEHQARLKQMDIELAKLEAKWSSWLKIPVKIVLLPVLLVMALGYCIHAITKKEPPESFWRLLR